MWVCVCCIYVCISLSVLCKSTRNNSKNGNSNGDEDDTVASTTTTPTTTGNDGNQPNPIELAAREKHCHLFWINIIHEHFWIHGGIGWERFSFNWRNYNFAAGSIFISRGSCMSIRYGIRFIWWMWKIFKWLQYYRVLSSILRQTSRNHSAKCEFNSIYALWCQTVNQKAKNPKCDAKEQQSLNTESKRKLIKPSIWCITFQVEIYLERIHTHTTTRARHSNWKLYCCF